MQPSYHPTFAWQTEHPATTPHHQACLVDPRYLVITPISPLQVCLAEPHQLLRVDPRYLVITPISLLQVCLAEPHQLLRMERRHTLGGASAALAVRPHATRYLVITPRGAPACLECSLS